MIPEYLSMVNFMGYKQKLSLDFAGKETIGIVGPNESGKSSILQAISFLLFGRTRADREVQLLNSGGSGDLMVEGSVLLSSGSKLEIARGRTRKGQPVLEVAGFTGKPSDVSAYLQEVLSINYEDFVSLSYFLQGDIHQFMEGKKLDFFKRWTRPLHVWGQYEEGAKEKVKHLEEKRERYTIKLTAARRSALMYSEVKERVRDLKEQVDRLEQEASDLRTKATGLLQDTGDKEDKLETMEDSLRLLSASLRRHNKELKAVKRELREISAGTCPILKIECEELSAQSADTQKRLRVKVERMTLTGERLSGQQEDLEDKIAETIPSKPSAELEQVQADLVEVERALSRTLRELGGEKARFEQIKTAKQVITKTTAQLEKVEQELRLWSFIKFMCGKSGVPALLIEQELSKVEESCNWVLQKLDYPKQIRFAAFKELASYEKICPVCRGSKWYKGQCSNCKTERPRKRKDDPTVTIIDGTTERPFALESGGARVLQSFSVRLACSLFVSALTGAPFQTIMLDETFAMLDQNNRRKMLTLVVGKLSQEFDLKRQFVVSHQEDITNAVDHLLIVTKERGTSRARWA